MNRLPRGVARPYAKAAFSYACEQKQLPSWSLALGILADVVSDPAISAILKNPNIDLLACSKAIVEAGKGLFTEELKNLLYLLAKKRRLIVLPELFYLFGEYCADYEKMIHVSLSSAYPISQAQKDKFVVALKIRLQRDVNIKFNEDPALLGGAVITVGDLVIDGSVKTALARLSNSLTYS